MDWNPITRKELVTLLASEEAKLDKESANLFKQIRVTPYAVPIHRGSNIESVFVVAKQGQIYCFTKTLKKVSNGAASIQVAKSKVIFAISGNSHLC